MLIDILELVMLSVCITTYRIFFVQIEKILNSSGFYDEKICHIVAIIFYLIPVSIVSISLYGLIPKSDNNTPKNDNGASEYISISKCIQQNLCNSNKCLEAEKSSLNDYELDFLQSKILNNMKLCQTKGDTDPVPADKGVPSLPAAQPQISPSPLPSTLPNPSPNSESRLFPGTEPNVNNIVQPLPTISSPTTSSDVNKSPYSLHYFCVQNVPKNHESESVADEFFIDEKNKSVKMSGIEYVDGTKKENHGNIERNEYVKIDKNTIEFGIKSKNFMLYNEYLHIFFKNDKTFVEFHIGSALSVVYYCGDTIKDAYYRMRIGREKICKKYREDQLAFIKCSISCNNNLQCQFNQCTHPDYFKEKNCDLL